MMRRWFLLVLVSVLSLGAAHAQNWALLNPAYKYNYSNDGSDTISNQIFVTHIDTLGVDSFRYELNRIGVVCDTCPASLGGPCDGCFAWVDQPQFFQRSAIVSSTAWVFLDPDTFLIRIDIGIGGTWPFTPDGSVVATVTAEDTLSLWGSLDTIRTIWLSNGDSLILSDHHGLLRWKSATGTDEYDLIGIGGPGVGRLLPPAEAYFNLHVGDVLQYRVDGDYYTGDPPFLFTVYSGIQKIQVTSRSELSAGYEIGYMMGSFYWNYPSPYTEFWLDNAMGSSIVIDSSFIHEYYHPVTLYPSSISPCTCRYYPETLGGAQLCLWMHSTTIEGRHQISSFRKMGPQQYLIGSLSSESVPGYPRLFALSGATNLGSFMTDIGVVESVSDYHFEGACYVTLDGAVINGDTIGYLHPDQGLIGPLGLYQVTHLSTAVLESTIVSDQLVLHAGSNQGEGWTVLDALGRVMLSGSRDQRTSISVDVSNLGSGAYFLRLEGGTRAFRFWVMR